MKLPAKLPRKVFSLCGAITVRLLSQKDAESLFGRTSYTDRTIEVAPGLTPEMSWLTFWHEVVHNMLFDTGVANVLDEKQTEAVCDAVGQSLMSMMRAGQLTVREPRSK